MLVVGSAPITHENSTLLMDCIAFATQSPPGGNCCSAIAFATQPPPGGRKTKLGVCYFDMWRIASSALMIFFDFFVANVKIDSNKLSSKEQNDEMTSSMDGGISPTCVFILCLLASIAHFAHFAIPSHQMQTGLLEKWHCTKFLLASCGAIFCRCSTTNWSDDAILSPRDDEPTPESPRSRGIVSNRCAIDRLRCRNQAIARLGDHGSQGNTNLHANYSTKCRREMNRRVKSSSIYDVTAVENDEKMCWEFYAGEQLGKPKYERKIWIPVSSIGVDSQTPSLTTRQIQLNVKNGCNCAAVDGGSW